MHIRQKTTFAAMLFLTVALLLAAGIAIASSACSDWPASNIGTSGLAPQSSTAAGSTSTSVSTSPAPTDVRAPSTLGSTDTTAVSTPSPTGVTTGSALASDSSPAAVASAASAPVMGLIEVGDGDMLERDIIPQLARVYALSTVKVKAALAACRPSLLIRDGLKDFRRMEGIILPGSYEIRAGARIETQIGQWIQSAEARFDRVQREVQATAAVNGLEPSQQLILASIVEAECLADAHEQEVATVFLNRLDQHGLLQSCVTVEYAVGYQRPYLLKTDIAAVSPYNTYHVAGLPPGPICSPDDTSLRAAITRKMDSAIHYFYYDYLQNDLFCFVRYEDFTRAVARSKEQFIARSTVGRWTKINKQVLYGR